MTQLVCRRRRRSVPSRSPPSSTPAVCRASARTSTWRRLPAARQHRIPLVSNGAGVLNQFYVETANVNAAEELVSMIQTQRAYELNSKVVSTSDAMLGRLTQLRRRR